MSGSLIGGVYAKPDESLKVTVDKQEFHISTWNDVIIDFPHKDQVCGIELKCLAGDVNYLIVTYYNPTAKEGEDPTWYESYTVKGLKLELQSASRMACADCIEKFNEKERNKVLGIKE